MEERKTENTGDLRTILTEILNEDIPQEALAEGNKTPIDNAVDFIEQEIEKAREEWTEELRQAFYDTFYKSGELWFDYIFEDGDTEAEQNAKEVVEEYWKEIISKLTTK